MTSNQEKKSETDSMLKSSSPLVSVCIPSYNCGEFIAEAINSVFDQEYDNIELIITDDASSDDSVVVINSTLKDTPTHISTKFQVLERNVGIAGNYNLLLTLASGSYIKILPADDYIHSECIKNKVEKFKQSDCELALVFCARNVITRSGKHVMSAKFFADGKVENRDIIRKCVVSGTNLIGEPGAVLFRKRDVDKVGFFDARWSYTGDIDYWSRLLVYGHAYAISKPLSVFRIDNNLSVKLGRKRVTHYWHVIRAMENRWKLPKYVVIWGYFRTVINEFLRRLVHFYCRIRG